MTASGSATSPSSTTNEPTTDPSTTSPTTGSEESSTGADDSSSGEVEPPPEGTEGCGVEVTDASEQWVEYTLDVEGVSRQYYVWLPPQYDPERPYPVVYQFHGCSGNEDRQNNNPPVQASSGADAIHIRGKAIDDCWNTGPQGSGVAFFDTVVPVIEASYCADPARRFATGYSSGAFMSHQLACQRGEMLRGVATIGGGVAGNGCQGETAAFILHDLNDDVVNINASLGARDAHLARNGCDVDTEPAAVEPAPCVAYAGCTSGLDVHWCQTEGQGHSRQDGLVGPAFWDFLAALPTQSR